MGTRWGYVYNVVCETERDKGSSSYTRLIIYRVYTMILKAQSIVFPATLF